MVFSVIGTPRDEQWPSESKILPQNFTPRLAKNLEVMFSELDVNGINLLERLLAFNPLERINAHDALLHPYFGQREIPPVLINSPTRPIPPPPPTTTTNVVVTSPNPFSVLNTTSSSLNSSVSADDSGYNSMIQ
jgi:serine/threonine protein kinase